MRARGYDVDDFVGRFSFNLNVFGNFWEQVAKFRAARKLWARNLKEKYGVKNPQNMYLRGLFGGGGYGLTKAQPENNIMRGAYYALSAALAGCTDHCPVQLRRGLHHSDTSFSHYIAAHPAASDGRDRAARYG